MTTVTIKQLLTVAQGVSRALDAASAESAQHAAAAAAQAAAKP